MSEDLKNYTDPLISILSLIGMCRLGVLGVGTNERYFTIGIKGSGESFFAGVEIELFDEECFPSSLKGWENFLKEHPDLVETAKVNWINNTTGMEFFQEWIEEYFSPYMLKIYKRVYDKIISNTERIMLKIK